MLNYQRVQWLMLCVENAILMLCTLPSVHIYTIWPVGHPRAGSWCAHRRQDEIGDVSFAGGMWPPFFFLGGERAILRVLIFQCFNAHWLAAQILLMSETTACLIGGFDLNDILFSKTNAANHQSRKWEPKNMGSNMFPTIPQSNHDFQHYIAIIIAIT